MTTRDAPCHTTAKRDRGEMGEMVTWSLSQTVLEKLGREMSRVVLKLMKHVVGFGMPPFVNI